MDFSRWLNNNDDKLRKKVRELVKNIDEADELYHFVVLQLLEKSKKIDQVPDNQKEYFFIRTIKNNYYSKTSPYYYLYKHKKHNHQTLNNEITEDFTDEEYKETIPDIEWVRTHLNDFNWFDKDLFLLWLELGTITNVAKQTKIPLNSVGRYINKTKNELRNLWKD